MVQASTIDLGISRASLIHTPVSSNDSSFFTSSCLSKAKKMTSSSTVVLSPRPKLTRCVYGGDHTNLPISSENQSRQVLIVVVLSWGLVFLITAHLDRLMPESFGFWFTARRMISMQQVTDLPDPTGPRMPRTKASSFIKAFAMGPGGL